MAQKQQLVEVRTDFGQTIVNKAIDKCSKQAFVKPKDIEYSLFTIFCIVWPDEMF